MRINLAGLGYHQGKAAVFVEPGNLLFKPEVLDNFTGTAGEALDELGEIGGDVVRTALELFEDEGSGVME